MTAGSSVRRALIAAAALAWAGAAGAAVDNPVRSLEDDFAIRVWSTREGLPQNSVNQIVQTRDGYLWLATFGGLARFDGVRFTVFDVSAAQGLATNRILSLFEDRAGNLWMGHETGEVSIYRDGSFRSYDEIAGPSTSRTRAFAEDTKGRIWVGSSRGVRRFEDGVFVSPGREGRIFIQRVSALLFDEADDLWLGGHRWEYGAALSRLRDGRYESFSWDPERTSFCDENDPACPELFVTALAPSGDGGFWLGTDQGLLLYRDGRFEERYRLRGRSASGGGVRAVLETTDGEVWFNTVDGLGVFAPEAVTAADGRPTIYETPFSTEVTQLVEDREGSIWAGTDGEGLARIRRRPVSRFTVADGLPARGVKVVTTDGAGGLWIGAGCNALTHYRDGHFVNHQPLDPFGCVSALLLDRAGDLWIGRNQLLSRLSNGRYTHYREPVVRGFIKTIFEDREGRLWVGGDRGGIAQFRDGHVVRRLTVAEGLVDNSVSFITQDRDGALWIGTAGGLSRWREGTFTNYTEIDGLAPGSVRAIHQDADGALWIGTYGGGLARLRDGRISRIGTRDGLADNVVSRILEDARGNLWMLGNLSLFYVSRRQLDDFADGRIERVECVSFGPDAGMAEGNGGGQPAGWRDRDGRLWLPTIDGLATIDGDDPPINRVPPYVIIERLVADGRLSSIDSGSTGVRVPPGGGDLEIHYTATTFSDPARARFRYRLLGYSEDWESAVDRRVAYYTNLSPGRYRFEVQAANNDGVWSDIAASLPIAVEPHYWETKWFLTLCLLGAGGLVVGSLRLWTRRVRAHNARLQSEVRERRRVEAEREQVIAELEARGAELERFTYTVSHDLKAPLITIRGFGDLLARNLGAGDLDAAGNQLERIRDAAERMRGLLRDLLELARIGHVLGPPEVVEPSLVAREAGALAVARIGGHGVELVVEDEIPAVFGDPVRLLEVFQNLIENAAKFMGDQPTPRIEVTGRRDGDEVIIEVRDNGIGIEPIFFGKVFELFERLPADQDKDSTGIGLALAKRIVEGHGGRIWIESEGFGRGSVFLFTLAAANRRPTS